MKKGAAPPEHRSHGPERQIFSGGDQGAGHIVQMHQIGQDQVINMAFVAGDKNERAFLRGGFDPVQPFGVQGHAVEHDADDPPDGLGGNADHGGIDRAAISSRCSLACLWILWRGMFFIWA